MSLSPALVSQAFELLEIKLQNYKAVISVRNSLITWMGISAFTQSLVAKDNLESPVTRILPTRLKLMATIKTKFSNDIT